MSDAGSNPPSGGARRLATLASLVAVVLGLGIVSGVYMVGHCSAFGGRCPADAPPLLRDDVFRIAAIGGFIAVGLPVWLVDPSRHRLPFALVVGVCAALVVATAARYAVLG